MEILAEKGFIEQGALEDRRKGFLIDLIRDFVGTGVGVEYLDPKYDERGAENDVKIDCAERLAECKTVCCRIPFALTRKEVETGIIRWALGRPYLIALDDDGYCTHPDRKTDIRRPPGFVPYV